MSALEFCFPRDGDVLIGAPDGRPVSGGFVIEARVNAPGAAWVLLNGAAAQRGEDGLFSAEIVLRGRKTRLEAAADTGARAAIEVYFCPEAEHTYRFTVDDFIRGFADLHENRARYASIFDNPYLAIFREAHERYGSRVHLNAFYETVDGAFNLSEMTDRYRREFSENADWLTFSFHAKTEFPDKPYRNASAETVRADAERVYGELARIAGDAARRDTTTIHWGALTREGARTMRAQGCRSLCGYFLICGGEAEYAAYQPGEGIVSYYLSNAQIRNLGRRCLWVDREEKLLFARLQMVLNAPELHAAAVEPFLNRLAERPAESAMIQMVIHEQYFYPDYPAWEPDYAERILTMARWMQEHGYRPGELNFIAE